MSILLLLFLFYVIFFNAYTSRTATSDVLTILKLVEKKNGQLVRGGHKTCCVCVNFNSD